MSLPSLPNSDTPYSSNIHRVAQILHSHFETTKNVLSTGNHNRHRLQHHTHLISNDALPLLLALEEEAQGDQALTTWLQDVAEKFLGLITHLLNVEAEAGGDECAFYFNSHIHENHILTPEYERANVAIPQPVTSEKTNKPGRPKKVVNVDLLKEAMQPTRRISQALLAERLGIHRNTLRAKLKENSIDTSFSDINDGELDKFVKSYRSSHPDSGIRYLTGRLRHEGRRVQQRRLKEAVKRVDKLGKTLRSRTTAKKQRKQYVVDRPHAFWHIDGHHKLILWGIVIHGVVDGYSRKASSIILVEGRNT